MPINRCRELCTGCYESSEILPFGPALVHLRGWAKISPLSSPLWITLEQATPFQTKLLKKKGKSHVFGYSSFVSTTKLTERRLAMIKRNKLDFSGQPIYIGLDVHKKSWSVSVFTKYGEYKTFSQPPKAETLIQYLRQHFPGAQYHSAYEAGYCGFWIHDQLREKGVQCMVVNPADIPTRDKERRGKRDPVDCRKLARGLRGGEIEGIYIPSRWKLEDRGLIRTRLSMGRKQARCKNQIKSMFLFYGVEIPEQREMGHWSRRFIRWIEGIRMERASGDMALKIHLEELCHLRQIIAKLNRAILALARAEEYRPWVSLLRTVPGISTLTAMILLTELYEITRFRSIDQLCSYVGLIPDTQGSGEKEHVGGITQRHHSQLRWLLIEASWISVRKDPALMEAFGEYCKRMRKTKAIIKIARKLLNRIRYVLKNQVEYVACIIE
jgi:transposase